MPTFYKGVGVGTYWHRLDPRTGGFFARVPQPSQDVTDLMRHIAGNTRGPFISLTRSYGIAETYARELGRAFPAPHNPAYIYEIEINDPVPRGTFIIDPVVEVAKHCSNHLLTPFSYHHDGDMNFLLGVVNPVSFNHHTTRNTSQPMGSSLPPHWPHLSLELKTLVRALRDAEIIVYGRIPVGCITGRYEVY